MKYIALFFSMLCVGMNAYSCTFTITNDTDQEIFVTDGNMHAVHISPQQVGTINPITQESFLGIIPFSWFFSAKLHVFQQLQDPNIFYKHFTLSEKYCSKEPKNNRFNISDIEKLPASFIERFGVVTYPMPKEPLVIPSKH